MIDFSGAFRRCNELPNPKNLRRPQSPGVRDQRGKFQPAHHSVKIEMNTILRNRREFVNLLFFILAAAGLAQAQTAPQWSWTEVDRIVAVGDIHGDYDQFIKVLQDSGTIDRKANWAGGKLHLVQLGDVPDRGPYPRKIMDLLMKLEKQAKKAGGQVHALIGDHEAMNLYGDLRYTTPEEYAEFRDSGSEQVRHAMYDQTIEEMRKKAEAAKTAAVIDEAFRRKFYEQYPLGFFEQRYAYGPKGKYGQWILGHNTIIRIDDTIFLHGGIGPKYADMAPDVINQTIRKELSFFTREAALLATDEEGPLWYRGFAEGNEQTTAPLVDAVLQNLGSARIVLGHTTTSTTVIPRFGGKVILDDVGLSKPYGGPPACLLIEKGTAYALHRGTRLKIPCESGEPLLQYLRSAAALDPQPSPIDKLIQALQNTPQSKQ